MDTQLHPTWLGILLLPAALAACSDQGLAGKAAPAEGDPSGLDSADTAEAALGPFPQLHPVVPDLGCPQDRWSRACWTRYPEEDGTQTIYAFSLESGAACVASRFGPVDDAHWGDLIRYEDSWVFQGADGPLRVHDDGTVEQASWYTEYDGPMVAWQGGFGVMDAREGHFRGYPDWDALAAGSPSTDVLMWPAIETITTDGVNIFGAWHSADYYNFYGGGPTWNAVDVQLEGWNGWILGLGSVDGELIVTDGGYNADHNLRVVTYDPGTGASIDHVRVEIPATTVGLWCERR